MTIHRTEWNALESYLPEGSISFVNELLKPYPLKLIITLPRDTILGYYKPPHLSRREHTITINKNLNPYAFLVVLLHEVAHLQTFVEYGLNVRPHGEEWKRLFGKLLAEASSSHLFPSTMQPILRRYIHNPATLKSCTDPVLMRELKKWDKKTTSQEGWVTVESIPIGQAFVDRKGRKMQIIKKQRTKYLCKEIHPYQERSYLYPALMEVKPIRAESTE